MTGNRKNKCFALLFTILLGLTFSLSAEMWGDWEFLGHQIIKYHGTGTNVTVPGSISDVTITSIRERAFLDNIFVTSVSIPASVEYIGYNAFKGCSELTTVNIPGAVTSIENSLFDGCLKLTSVTIPSGVTTIGKWAFRDCSSLPNTTIPDGVTSIGDSAFEGCFGFTSVTIPDSTTSIGSSAFEDCINIYSLTLGKAITSIGSSAFAGCLNLFIVNEIPAGVTEIKQSTFVGCMDLTHITIPSSVSQIGAYAFSGCEELFFITIPDAVTVIEEGTFSGCESLDTIIIPSNVTELKHEAFYGSGLRNVEIQTKYAQIGNRVFMDCAKLTDVVFSPGADISRLGEEAFSGCSALEAIVLPKGIETIQKNTFENCTNLETFTFHDSLLRIRDYAFRGCTKLQDFKLPNDFYYIGKEAFAQCSSLNSLTFPKYMNDLLDRAFWNSGLSSAIFLGDEPTTFGDDIFQYTADDFTIYHRDDATGFIVDDWLDYNICKYRELNSKITITHGAVEGHLELLSTINGFPVVAIGAGAYNDSSLMTISIPDTVVAIGNEAFKKTELITIDIPDTVAELGASAFEECPKLNSVTMGTGVSIIHHSTFKNCDLLQTITIGPNVGTISDSAFENCVKLSYASIPDTVMEIGERAFYMCESLKSLTLVDKSLLLIGKNAFGDCKLLEKVEIPDTVTSLGAFAFQGCENLSSVSLSENIDIIDEAVFMGCSKLNNVTLPKGVTAIGDNAFSDCLSLENLTIGNEITSIGGGAFYKTNLQYLYFPPTVTSIGIAAFKSCLYLDYVVFEGNAPASFGLSVFDECGPDFKIHYYKTKTGFTTPEWKGYPCFPLEDGYFLTVVGGTGDGFYPEGTIVSVSATIPPGYSFVNWSGAVGNINSPTTTFTMGAEDATITANFTINKYTLTYTAGSNGTITGTTPQTVAYKNDGTEVTAVPDTNYLFVDWSDGSTENPRTDTNVTADITVTANFATNLPGYFTVTFAAGSGGTISGEASQTVAASGDCVAVAAAPDSDYRFLKWTIEGADYSTDNPLTVTNVSANMALTAIFIPSGASAKLRLRVNPMESGSVAASESDARLSLRAGNSDAGVSTVLVDVGGDVAITATANPGYTFSGWTGSGTAIISDSRAAKTSVRVSGDAMVTANFSVDDVTVDLTMAISPSDGAGTTSPSTGTTTINSGAVRAITAVAADGYVFVEWQVVGDANILDKYAASTSAVVNNEAKITAIFATSAESTELTIGVSSASSEGGFITNSGANKVKSGGSRMLIATCNPGFVFTHWETSGKAEVANPFAAKTTVRVNGDSSVNANFAKSNTSENEIGRIRIVTRSGRNSPGYVKISRAAHTLSTFDPETDVVQLLIDGAVFEFNSDLGVFTELRNGWKYQGNDGNIHLFINIAKGYWTFLATGISLNGLDNTDGINIALTVGEHTFGANLVLDELRLWKFNLENDTSISLPVPGKTLEEFEIEKARGKINNVKNSKDTIKLQHELMVLPEGVAFDPATMSVTLNIDQLAINIPGASFKNKTEGVYKYNDKKNGIRFRLDFNKKRWGIVLSKADAWNKINPDDGIDVSLRIGDYQSGVRLKANSITRYKYNYKHFYK